jgi:outer membrane lipoprotein-sorting protein
MIDIIGILTRTWLGVHSPAPQQPTPPVPAAARAKIHTISTAPLVATPAAGAATGSATTPAPAKTPATTPAKTPAKTPATPAKGSGAADAKTPAPAADPKTPPAAAPAAAPADANGVVNEVQKFYAGIKQVTAQFRQSVTNNTFGSTKTSDGTVWLMKPGKMRWDYVEKKKDNKTQVKKSFISNGTYLYVVEHDNKQVVKKNLANDLMPVAVTFLYGKGDLKAEFNAAIDTTGKYGSKDDIVLKMTPKKPSAQYKSLFLVVAKDNYRVKQSVIVDSSDNVNQFMFFGPDFEKSIKDSWFEFDERSVKNYRIIDADQPQGSAAPAALPPATK